MRLQKVGLLCTSCHGLLLPHGMEEKSSQMAADVSLTSGACQQGPYTILVTVMHDLKRAACNGSSMDTLAHTCAI
jgi:hypothetical protein